MAMDADFCDAYANRPSEHTKKIKENFLDRIYFLRVAAEVMAKPPQLFDPDKWMPSEQDLKQIEEILRDPEAALEKWKKEHEPDDHS